MRFALPAGILEGGRYDDWDPQVPQYVLCDVDGTLIGPEVHASGEVVAAVERAQRAGLRVGFATGRMRLAVEPLWEQLRTVGPHVLHNGGEVRFDQRTVASWPLGDDQIRAVFGLVAELGVYAEFYVEEGFYVTARDPSAQEHWHVLGHEPLGVVTKPEDLDGDVLKVTFALFEGRNEHLLDGLVGATRAAGLRAGSSGSPLTPATRYVNATHRDADKGVAVATAARAAGVDLAHTVAVGDDRNDLSMFGVVGTAIAMGQAPAEVRAAAHLIVPEVTQDGVAHALDACIAWRQTVSR